MLARPLLVAALLVLPSPGIADVLQIPLGQQGQADMALPQTGQTKLAVLQRFGLADDEYPPVGEPPITRWDYREFSVYFEAERVISAVRHHRPAGTGSVQP